MRLADREPELLDMLKRNEAYSMVMSAVKRLVGWLGVVLGAIAMGSDSIKEFIRQVIDGAP